MHAVTTGLALLLMPALLGGCNRTPQSVAYSVGSPQKGAKLIRHYGCGACHTIPGIAEADGVVGPPLTALGRRIYIAGLLRNTPDNLIAWLLDPQAIVPGNAMPVMGLSQDDARNVAAYLYTLR